MSTSNSNIVVEWLRSLHLGQYAESFLDNGYDDLEICKQVGDPDLDAIGVFNPNHRHRLLHSVRTLREEGAASVYFTLEETAAIHDECMCDSSSSRTESSIGKHGSSERDISDKGEEKDVRVSSRNSSRSNDSSKDVSGKFRDEYEEGKAELVKIPRLQLKILLKEKLQKDGIRLSCQPYSTSNGERGYLEGLASRYADLFNTHYGDVLEHLEELRRREWEDMSPRIRVIQPGTPGTPPGTYSPTRQVASVSLHGLTTSLSQPIYVPGKYSPSSCLSDKEEDEIYGFAGYGVYGKQMLQRQQQRMMLAQAQTVHAHGYQTCLSPRSAYFYEFPPTEQANTQTSKKKTSFSKFLRGLKTVHRKEKHGTSSPRHGRDSRLQGGPPNSRVGTPDSLLDGPSILPLPAMDPRMLNYDQLRVLQMNGSASGFEETIRRLKIQDALKQKERFNREHEEILRDIRQGLNQLRKEAARGSDDTYMYDDDVRAIAPHHWYDEPPYESDPEEFLMGLGNGQPAATIHNGRVCFTLNLRSERQREGIMSHPSAGDISIPRDTNSAPRRGLILPQSGPYPPTIIPLTHARSCRESGDYAGSDVQSLSSRLSTFSMETTRSEQQDYHHLPNRCKTSSNQSSDYEDHELPSPTNRPTAEGAVNNKHSRHKRSPQDKESTRNKNNLPSASSAESIPSGSGSSTQALVREASGHSSLSAGDDEGSSPIGPAPQGGNIAVGPVIGKARALVDCIPNPYDREALKFKKGDIIDILQMNPSGLWQGICHGKAGLFKFINVELLSDRAVKRLKHHAKYHRRGKPKSVEELLKRISMEEHTSVFVLNGYEDVELFQDLESQDLDYLGIRDPEHRAKILTAVQLLHDYDSPEEKDIPITSSSDESLNSTSKIAKKTSSLKNLRDSGCFEDDQQSKRRSKGSSKTLDPANNLDANGKNMFYTTDGRKPQIKAKLKQFQTAINSNEDSENLEMDVLSNHVKINYHPNIPVSERERDHKKTAAKDFLEQTREVLDRAREIANNSREILERTTNLDPNESSKNRSGEESCETNAKLTMVKYVVGGYNDLGVNCESGNAGFSEKSSDSGVSSSSLSSNNFKDRKVGQMTDTTPKIQRLESPRATEKIKLFSSVCDNKNKIVVNENSNSNNPFLNNSKARITENSRVNESPKDSIRKNQTTESPTRSFPSQFQNRSLIVQKKS